MPLSLAKGKCKGTVSHWDSEESIKWSSCKWERLQKYEKN